MAKEYTELQLKAKAAGIKGWHVKLAKTLEDELAKMDVEEKPVVAPPKKESSDSELIDLMQGMTWDNVWMKIKLRGSKSKFYPWKDLVEKKVNG